MSQMVTVNGTTGLLLDTTENQVVVQYGFGVVTHNKDDVLIEKTSKPVPKYLSGVSHEEIVKYARAASKRVGPTKKDLCEKLMLEMIGEQGENLQNGSVRPNDLKAGFMELGCSKAQANTYYYQLKKQYEETWGTSLTAPKREKAEGAEEAAE